MAQTNKAVLAELKEKLGGVTPQAISQRRAGLTKKVAMPTDIATYVVAQREGVKIAKHLDEQTLGTVAEYSGRLREAERDEQAPPAVAAKRQVRPGTKAKEIRLDSVKVPSAVLPAQKANDAVRMAGKVYPMLYVFENSAREFVRGHLEASHGGDWWDEPGLVPKGVLKVVERNRTASDKNRWVDRADVHPIYMTELGHLGEIIVSEKGWKVFADIFNRQSWVTETFKGIEAPRNVVAHMNALTANNIKGIETRCREWYAQIKDHMPR